jgi:hypothetical protein
MDWTYTAQDNSLWTTPVNESQRAENSRLPAAQAPRSMYIVWFFKQQLFRTARVTCRHISDDWTGLRQATVLIPAVCV